MPGVRLPEAGVEWLLELLDLQHVGQGVYTGAPAPDGDVRTRMFGGQLIAQALAAASFTTDDDLHCKSLHAYFVRPAYPNWQVASLDHAIWFHRPFRADEWLLFSFDCTNVSAERGLNHGLVYAQNGALVASITQEALLRPRDPLVT